MFRTMVLCGFLLFLQTGCAAAGSRPIKIDFQSQQRTLCGFTFLAVKDLVIEAKPILENALKNRSGNERFDACPYWVNLKYKAVSMRVDFSRDVTLNQIKNLAENDSVKTGLFAYEDGGWKVDAMNLDIGKGKIAVHEKAASVAVSGVVTRQIINTSEHDYCFGLVVISADKYMIGTVCKPTINQLESFEKLFGREPVIFAPKS